ncbi:MAG: zinc metallopeptidase [Saprospiraceae bacterium]|nr:zinc metallopeptidase [Saprospiraceae bacterium]MBK6565584.1 zinc metallopeptidase [Saprospiraceae bacterium]MBK8081954.1 zinc metallopeptidase [Saprospiraceae bacterium]MBK8370524.1 zinc metallopeptidase [Saprospiraceae bacterium]MBK8546552.1 zinc metallopeptidase [Saprospiraceae bacterium]
MIGYYVIFGVFALIGMVVSGRLKGKFAHYSRIPVRSGLSGKEVAEKMLAHYGVHDVNIVEGQGFLTDHYNPQNKTVSLSPDVFHGTSIASAAVAAHECGHAVQHAQSYSMLTLRSRLVPVVQFSANIQQFLFMGALIGLGSGLGGTLMIVMVATFGITALFSLVTLPVEFDASNRALAWLDNSGTLPGQEHEGAKDALWWAAMTYVAQALGALVMFLYFLLSFLGRSSD